MRDGVHIVKPPCVRTPHHSRAFRWDCNGIITGRKTSVPSGVFARLRNQPDRDGIWIKRVPRASAGINGNTDASRGRISRCRRRACRRTLTLDSNRLRIVPRLAYRNQKTISAPALAKRRWRHTFFSS